MMTNFDSVPDDDLEILADNLMSFVDTLQKHPGILSSEAISLLALVESDIYSAMIARGLIECYGDMADIPIIETDAERITSEMPVLPELESEAELEDTQPTRNVFDEYIETLDWGDEDGVG